MQRLPIYHFLDTTDTGINAIPLKSIVHIKAQNLHYILKTKTGLTSSSTVQDAIDNGNLGFLNESKFLRKDIEDTKSGLTHFNDYLTFEGEKHLLTWNDGAGNFQLRIGHYYDSANDDFVVTENGVPMAISFSQGSPGNYKIKIAKNDYNAGDTFSSSDFIDILTLRGSGNHAIGKYSSLNFYGADGLAKTFSIEDDSSAFTGGHTKTSLISDASYLIFDTYHPSLGQDTDTITIGGADPDLTYIIGETSIEAIDRASDYSLITKDYLSNSMDVQTVWYLDPVNGDDNNDGSSSSKAFKTIQKTVQACSPLSQNLVYVLNDVTILEDDNGSYGGVKISGKTIIFQADPSLVGGSNEPKMTIDLNSSPSNFSYFPVMGIKNGAIVTFKIDMEVKQTYDTSNPHGVILISDNSILEFIYKKDSNDNKIKPYIIVGKLSYIANVSTGLVRTTPITLEFPDTADGGSTNCGIVNITSNGIAQIAHRITLFGLTATYKIGASGTENTLTKNAYGLNCISGIVFDDDANVPVNLLSNISNATNS